MSAAWNYADLWEVSAELSPEAPTLIHGESVVSWGDFDRRANGVAATLLDAGLSHQAKVALYLRNRSEYVETLFAAFKASLVPVNTNYRYGDDELAYLWSDCDAAAVVFDAEFTDTANRLRKKLPGIRTWLRVGATKSCPAWAMPYEDATMSHPSRVESSRGRSGDDLYLQYTGGTTGQPKGVMWRQDDLFQMLEISRGTELPEHPDPIHFVRSHTGSQVTVLPAAPLMHGTACWFVLPILARGGAVVTLTQPSLDATELLDTIVLRRIKGLCVAGEAFVRPLLQALEAAPDRWDLSCLRVVFSSGAMLSQDSKFRLLRFAPRVQIVDGLGSSESGGLAHSVTSAHSSSTTASFQLSSHTRVIDIDGTDIAPGSGRAGRLAVTGHLPLGYYGDPEKTAATFVDLDGRRYVIAGDWAEVAANGSIMLLGRGSSCINTGGEKVYPEEVEEILKAAPGVRDAGVVGLPDERFGEVVTALVVAEAEGGNDEVAMITYAKSHLAGYKVPKHLFVVDSLPRGPNGKLDHKTLKEQAGRIAGGVTRNSTE